MSSVYTTNCKHLTRLVSMVYNEYMNETEERFYTLSDAAEALNISRPTMMKMFAAGELPGATQGDKGAEYRIPHSTVQLVRAGIILGLQEKIRDMMEREIQHG